MRSTELQFVDDREIGCPRCQRPRPLDAPSCPHCGAKDVLEPLSAYTLNFRISSLLVLTALVAVCVAVARLSPGLGVACMIVVSASALRAALLVRERKRHRYEVTLVDLWRLFVWSMLGVLLGGFVFFMACLMESAVLTLVLGPAELFRELAAWFVFLLAVHAIAGALISWDAACQRTLLRAVVWGLGSSAVVLFAELTLPVTFALWTLLLPLATALAGMIHVASRRGGGRQVRAFAFGHSAALSLAGLAGLAVVPRSVLGPEAVALGLLSLAAALWPTLVTAYILGLVWSWDDAFPAPRQVVEGYYRAARPGRPAEAVSVEPAAEGIEFQE